MSQILARLSRAEASLNVLKTTVSLSDAREAWIDFLVAAGTVFSKLEQACKADKKSKAWYDKIKYQRRSDQLLVYIHQARNSHEHSVDEITVIKTDESSINFLENPKDGDTITFSLDQFGKPIITTNSEVIVINEYMHPTLVVISVRNSKYGDVFEPPKQHLGQPVTSLTPSAIAEHALNYLNLIFEQYCSL